MAGHETTAVRPKASQDRLHVAAGSPLAIQGIFLEVLRERFRLGSGLEWTWTDDHTQSDILIEAGYNDELESRSQSPALFVTRLETRPEKIAIGDRKGVHLPDHKEVFTALMHITMLIECVANTEGESSILGDIVQFMLLASQDVIQREFGLHHFEHPIMGQTTPYSRDKTKWLSPVSFSIQFHVHWAQVPIAPLIQQFTQRVSERGTDLFRQTVLNSMRRATPDE